MSRVLYPLANRVKLQALSDLSLIFRSAVLGSTGDVLNMFADILKDRSANRVSVA